MTVFPTFSILNFFYSRASLTCLTGGLYRRYSRDLRLPEIDKKNEPKQIVPTTQIRGVKLRNTKTNQKIYDFVDICKFSNYLQLSRVERLYPTNLIPLPFC